MAIVFLHWLLQIRLVFVGVVRNTFWEGWKRLLCRHLFDKLGSCRLAMFRAQKAKVLSVFFRIVVRLLSAMRVLFAMAHYSLWIHWCG